MSSFAIEMRAPCTSEIGVCGHPALNDADKSTALFSYRARTSTNIKSEHDDEIPVRVNTFGEELEAYQRRRMDAISKKETSHALWSLNRNMFWLVNMLCAVQGWESLPVEEEEVEKGQGIENICAINIWLDTTQRLMRRCI